MRDILHHATRFHDWTRASHYAARLAARLDASLTGLYAVPPVVPVPAPTGAALAPDFTVAQRDLIEQATAASVAFADLASGHGVRHADWQVAEGAVPEVLAYAGNWHDLLVVGRNGEDVLASVAAVGQTLMHSGLPCLVVPEEHDGVPALAHVAIAWNASAEAIRALHAALPLLKLAERITVLRGKPRDAVSSMATPPRFDVDAWMQRQGLTWGSTDLPDGGRADGLLDAAVAAGADLLVMGAYGRSRFSEWMLGGATRRMLEQKHLAVFMRH